MLIRWGQISLLALLAVFTLFIAGDVRNAASQETSADTDDATSLDDLVSGSGRVESAETVNIRSQIAGTITEIVADGTQVQAGDVIARIDDSPLRDDIAAREISLAQAQARLEQAQARLAAQTAARTADRGTLALQLEIAELELRKYQEAEFPLEVRHVESRIEVAEAQVAALTGRAARLESLVGEQAAARDELDGVRIELIEARANLEQARLALTMLTEYEQPLKTKKLELVVAEARAALEQVDRAGAAAQIEAEAGLAATTLAVEDAELHLSAARDSIKQCTIHAPRDGAAFHFGRPSSIGSNVREGQVLLQIPDLSRLRVRMSVTGEKSARVRAGQPVRIFVGDPPFRFSVEDDDEATVHGTVLSTERPPSNAVRRSSERIVLVEVDDTPPELRFGARVLALIDISDVEDSDR